MKLKHSLKGLLALFIVLFLAACGGNSETGSSSDDSNSGDSAENKGSSEEIEMGLINWPENIAVNHVWKVLLEEKGYDVKLTQLEMGTIMAALDTGDLEVGIEVWLPVQDISYYEQYKDTVDFAEEPWYENGIVGLVVPEYMDHINSIEDLNEHKDEFEGLITGFEPGAGTMEVTELVIDEYDLDYELVPSSEPAMLAAVREAMKKEEPIVAPLWKPHGIFSELDLKFLEDPKNVYGAGDEIFLATRQGFDEDFPEVYEWLTNWKVDDDTIADLINSVVESDDPIEAAKQWIEENRDLADEWVS